MHCLGIKMKIIELPGYGPTAPRIYLPVENIISFHLVDFGGDLCVCHNHGEAECHGCPDCEDDYDDYEDY